MNVYQEIIRLATGVTAPADLEEIEDYMRNVYWHSTLDWQGRGELEISAKKSWEEIKLMRYLREPIRRLYCSCCGGVTRGRQWHNRDTGHGLCVDCIPLVSRPKFSTPEDVQRNYGVRGVHYDLPEPGLDDAALQTLINVLDGVDLNLGATK